ARRSGEPQKPLGADVRAHPALVRRQLQRGVRRSGGKLAARPVGSLPRRAVGPGDRDRKAARPALRGGALARSAARCGRPGSVACGGAAGGGSGAAGGAGGVGGVWGGGGKKGPKGQQGRQGRKKQEARAGS